MNMNKLIAFIREHGCNCFGVDTSTGVTKLAVTSIDSCGNVVYEYIEPTIKAVRDWLGY